LCQFLQGWFGEVKQGLVEPPPGALFNRRLHYKDKIREAVCLHTGLSGSDKELRSWYQDHKGTLSFNPQTKLFVAQ
jgi:hypothetical protein